MNFLAKHFFDYQSFINLPHTAVQMHKTPPSQAGTDPSAAWAPKDLHLAGKNQAAPAARANRNYHGDQRTGSHRHGRPSKLEFRSWGERHGELREEKIVPHKDHWMEVLEGGNGRRVSLEIGSLGPQIDHFPSEYFPRALQQRPHQPQQRRQHSLEAPLPPSIPFPGGGPIRVLVILTISGHLDFITVTIKAVRGLPSTAKDPLLKLRLFDGSRLLEERGPLKATTKRSPLDDTPTIGSSQNQQPERQLGQSFLLKAPNPLRLPFCQMALSLHSPGGHSRGQSANLRPLGNCLLGPSGNISRANSHWRQMIKKMGVPIAMWHELTLAGEQQQGPAKEQRKLDKSPPRKSAEKERKKGGSEEEEKEAKLGNEERMKKFDDF